MKNVLHKLSISTIFIFIFLIANQLIAQEPAVEVLSKEELKLQKLELKVKNLEGKVEATEAKIAYADSLIQAGIEMGNEAYEELKVIENEEKIFAKENNSQRKIKAKQLKKADDEDVKMFTSELKAIDTEYKNAIKAFDKRYRIEDKKLVKADSNDKKGTDKLKQYSIKLEDYLDALEIANEKLETFIAETDL